MTDGRTINRPLSSEYTGCALRLRLNFDSHSSMIERIVAPIVTHVVAAAEHLDSNLLVVNHSSGTTKCVC